MENLEAREWLRPHAEGQDRVRATVAAMLARIEAEGDGAIAEFSHTFDGFEPETIPLENWQSYALETRFRDALTAAAERIEKFARMQREMYRDAELHDEHGRFGQRIVPLERMAAYIPGGRFPLVSTALMTLIPARVAGVRECVAVSPSRHPGILAAASLAGATAFLHLGGVQAIAAVALGSRWQPAVDMVVGPGNAYVNAAKAIVADRVMIDTLAGPSEILVLCDDSANPEWLALDVLAQAEHDPMALSVLACIDRATLLRVAAAIQRESAANPGKDCGLVQLVHCRDVAEMGELSERMAPEHLQVVCRPGLVDTSRLTHYGSLFVGGRSAVALGDYCTGPNHTLPTLGVARRKGGLSVGAFLKILTWQEVDGDFAGLAHTAMALAELEGLDYHRRSLAVRLDA